MLFFRISGRLKNMHNYFYNIFIYIENGNFKKFACAKSKKEYLSDTTSRDKLPYHFS
jgi:hypothetical protein